MKQLILCFSIFLCLFTLTKEEIRIKRQINITPAEIDEFVDYFLHPSDHGTPLHKFNEDCYGYNAQYCNLTEFEVPDKRLGIQSCYVSLYPNKHGKWYNFCGKVKMGEYKNNKDKIIKKKDFVENYKEIILFKNETTKKFFDEEKKNKIRIDCFSKQLKYLSLFSMLYSLLLL